MEDLGDVGLQGAFGDVQSGGDGPVGHTLDDQYEHLRPRWLRVTKGILLARRPISRETIVGSGTVSLHDAAQASIAVKTSSTHHLGKWPTP